MVLIESILSPLKERGYEGLLKTRNNKPFYDCTEKLIGLNSYFGGIDGFIESFLDSLCSDEDISDALASKNLYTDNKSRDIYLAGKIANRDFVSGKHHRLLEDLREINRSYRELYASLLNSYKEENKKGFYEDLGGSLAESSRLKMHARTSAEKIGISNDSIVSKFVSDVLYQIRMIPIDLTSESKWKNAEYADVCRRLDVLFSVDGFTDTSIEHIVDTRYRSLTELASLDRVLRDQFGELTRSINALYRKIELFDGLIGYTKKMTEKKNYELLKMKLADEKKNDGQPQNGGIVGDNYVAATLPDEAKFSIKHNDVGGCA